MEFNRKTFQFFVSDNFETVKDYLSNGIYDRREAWQEGPRTSNQQEIDTKQLYAKDKIKVGDIVFSNTHGPSMCIRVAEKDIDNPEASSFWTSSFYSDAHKKTMWLYCSSLKEEDCESIKFDGKVYSFFNFNKKKCYIWSKQENDETKYYYCNYYLNLNPSDSDLWDSFFTLYSIIGYASTKKGFEAASINFEECVKVVNSEIANPLRYLLGLADQHMQYIFKAFGIENECLEYVEKKRNQEGTKKGVNYEDRIAYLKDHLDHIGDSQLRQNCKGMIPLMYHRKSIRNAAAHREELVPNPVVQWRRYLMDFVITVYLIKYILKRQLVIPIQTLEDMKRCLYYPVSAEEEVIIEEEGGIIGDAIKIDKCHYYIPAFKKYAVKDGKTNSKSIEFEVTNLKEVTGLEIRSFNGEIHLDNSAILELINRIEYNPILESIQKQLTDIRNSTISQDDVDVMMSKVIKDINTQISDKLRNNTENICAVQDELSRVRDDYENNKDEIVNHLNHLRERLNHEDSVSRHEKMIKRVIWTIVITFILLILSAGFYAYLRFGDNIPQSLYDLAYECNNKDAAYNNAILLENEKKYPEAADWYLKAREQYANLLADNPNDSIRASRLAEMTMRGKSGIINTDIAEYYAHMAKRYDLEAYLALTNGNVYKAKDIVNNYQGENTAYLELADVLSTLFYPKEHGLKEIELCWTVLDSLASTTNQATQEAIEYAIAVRDNGVQDKDGNYLIAPSLYDALCYAQDADNLFNSVRAQLYLAAEFESMNLIQDAELYHAKASANNVFGYGEITFSHDRINELTNDPQALVARAHNNARKGYTDYRMTAYYYHIADSINNAKRLYKLGMQFYTDWLNFVVHAADINSIGKILPLINKEYPDSLRVGMAEYIMALKYVNDGGGVSLDANKSGELLKSAASRGLEDAQVAVGISWDIDSIADGMKILERFVAKEPSQVHPYAARYIMSKYYKQGEIIPDFLRRFKDEFALLIKLNMLDTQDFGKLDTETLVSLKHQINIVLSDKTDYFDSAFLLGKLAEIEYLLEHKDEANFYISMADKISPKDAYSSYFGISEIARKSGDIANATFFAGRFAKVFFLKDSKVLYEPERANVVGHLYNLYPDILDLVKENVGHDFTNDGYFFFVDQNLKEGGDIKKYESPVKNLRIELPDYVKATFPITMKYFD